MALQTADNHTRLVRKRQLLWPFSRTLTTQPDPDQPGIPSYIPVANEIARELANDLDAIPQSTLNEVLLDTSTRSSIATPSETCMLFVDPACGRARAKMIFDARRARWPN